LSMHHQRHYLRLGKFARYSDYQDDYLMHMKNHHRDELLLELHR